MPHDYGFMHLPKVSLIASHEAEVSQLQNCDATVLVFNDINALEHLPNSKLFGNAISQAQEYLKHDESAGKKEANLILGQNVPGEKLILAPTGPLLRDQDDVRRYAEATMRAIKRAKATGTVKNPLIVLQPPPFDKMEESIKQDFTRYYEVATLAALAELHESLEAREALPELSSKYFQSLTVVVADGTVTMEALAEKATFINAVEMGRRLARDIGGPDPERMTSIVAAETVRNYFSNIGHIKCEVIEDYEVLKKEFPLLAAVSRASEHVPRHAPRVVHLEYRSPDQSQVKEELFMVGKGINYDTGGADLKVGGNMVGMSRDKCGAAAMAGFMATCAALQPKHINLSIHLAFVRNSIGSNAYVSDEIIKSRAGVRVRVGNTDAEGRMVMADLLALNKERALALSQPEKARLFTCATLTGHVCISYGPYAAAMDNGPAKLLGLGERIKEIGQKIGDCFEVSTLRREDFDFIAGRSNAEDVLQANRAPSSVTPRGHQYPAAFLMIASGLTKHGLDVPREQRLAYTHLDIAGAAEESPGPLGRPTGTPIAALSATFLKN